MNHLLGSVAILTAALLLESACLGQQEKVQSPIKTLNGLTLQEIFLTEEEAVRNDLLERYITKYPTDEANGGILEQLRTSYLRLNQAEKLMPLMDRQLKANPADIDTAYFTLKMAEEAKNPEQTHKWQGVLFEAAQQYKRNPGADQEKVAQMSAYCDYLLYMEANSTTDPKKRTELLDALTSRSPQGPYTAQALALRFDQNRKSGDRAKVTAYADDVLALDPNNEDALALAAEGAYQKHEWDKSAQYCLKLLAALERRAKSGNNSDDGEWLRKRNRFRARAYYIAGTAHMSLERYATADQELRQALPLNRGDDQVTAFILFQLGWANYQLHNYKEALRFNLECKAMRSGYQDQAIRNIAAIEFEMGSK